MWKKILKCEVWCLQFMYLVYPLSFLVIVCNQYNSQQFGKYITLLKLSFLTFWCQNPIIPRCLPLKQIQNGKNCKQFLFKCINMNVKVFSIFLNNILKKKRSLTTQLTRKIVTCLIYLWLTMRRQTNLHWPWTESHIVCVYEIHIVSWVHQIDNTAETHQQEQS